MRLETSPLSWLSCTVVLTLAFWTCFGACVDSPVQDDPPQARIVASWDPLQCGPPHRVAVALVDDAGAPISSSTICATGSLGVGEQATVPVDLEVDEAVLHWQVETPK